jgi:hypothetical protein
MRKCCVKTATGELAANVVLIDADKCTAYHDCNSDRKLKSSIDDMFCMDNNKKVALKFTYEI